jgi:hypothetical protein
MVLRKPGENCRSGKKTSKNNALSVNFRDGTAVA